MLHIGLTGNIGSGKTTVARIFKILGVPVYHADQEAKKFLGHPQVVHNLVAFFGNDILGPDKQIDKKALAAIVFNNDEDLARLNSLIHPLVRDDAKMWAASFQREPFVIHEAAIIFESGFRKEYDKVIHVSCEHDIALRRVMKRDGSSEDEVLSRMRHQWSDTEKCRLADFIIRNNGSEMVVPQVLKIYEVLKF
jgi:dephospho-CoA kinase